MKKRFLTWSSIGVVGLALTLTSCGGGEEKEPEQEPKQEVVEEDTNEVVIEAPEFDPNMNYAVPTPNELFTIIKETGVEFDASILNSADNASSYTSKKHQALNFGIYSADLAFTSSFEIGAEALKYFSTIKSLSNDLGINNAFDETVFKRVEENINSGNSDSLLMLSNDTYFQAYSYLEDNDRGSTLALIVLGGWVESLYIMTNLSEYEEGSSLVERVGEQKLTMENLMGFLMSYESDSDIAETMEELAEIEELFWSFEEEEGSATSTTEEEGMYVLSGGSTIVVTEEQYNSLKEKISELRNDIVEGEL